MADDTHVMDASELHEHQLLEQTWQQPRGFFRWFTHVHHQSIGKRFIITAFIFFFLGGVLALLMRLQLARPQQALLGPDLYNQIFTVHGSTMMFLFAVPVVQGMGIYLVPLMLGTRDFAFPRLNAFSYWIYVLGGIVLYAFFLCNTGPDAGWFTYVPLAGPEYSPGKRIDVWQNLINFTELSALGASVGLIVTIFKLRAPGMSLNRLPLFVWSILVMSFMVVFAMPAVITASLFATLDRMFGMHFFNPAEGGDALLWQHLFWFFGHPEVYIIFMPGLGMVSAIVQTFSHRAVFGYTPMVLSLIATGFMAFGLWVHHMFATGLPQLGLSFFTAASMMIAIPSGVQIFCWIATLWRGRPRLHTPLLFVLGFVCIFVLGGLTGVMLASVALDLQVHDTFFVVAHLHYVLIGGAVFPLFGAVYYWFPKITGRLLSERAGTWNFWLMFIGFNLTFFPMHQLGLQGMPRRIYTYVPETGWGSLNLLATVGGIILALGVLVFVGNILWSRRHGQVAGSNPWDADTLEWGTSSPPPSYNFLHVPVVQGREALWVHTAEAPVVTGLRSDRREVLVTRILDAEPDHRTELPGPSIWPLALALAVTVAFVGAIFTPWAVPVSAVLCLIALIGWAWPYQKKTDQEQRIAGQQL